MTGDIAHSGKRMIAVDKASELLGGYVVAYRGTDDETIDSFGVN